MGSAPTANAATRGIDDRRIKLGCVFPGEPVATFGDALRRLSDRSTYLYDNAGRYWFSTQPSVNRLAADRAAQQRDDDVLEEVRRRLRLEQADRGLFARVHPAPASASDVPDDDEVALVILGPEVTHSSKTDVSKARDAARTILDQRGTGARRHRNMLVFLAADTDKLGSLEDAVRTYLAWKSVDEDKPNLTLDAFQVNQIATKRKEADDTVTARIPEAYQWLLVPTQPDPLGPVDLPATRLTGGGSLAVRAGTKLRSDGGVIVKFGGGHAAPRARPAPGDLVVGRRRPQVPLGPVLDLRLPAASARRVRPHRGGPRRRERLRLARLVRLRVGQGRGRAVPRARHGRPAVRAARRRVRAGSSSRRSPRRSPRRPSAGPSTRLRRRQGGGTAGGDGTRARAASPAEAPVRTDPTRYFGSVSVDGSRPGPKFGQLATEVIAHLAALDGADVSVTVEIKAKRAAGFPSDVVRIVNENASQLKFDPGIGFEDE